MNCFDITYKDDNENNINAEMDTSNKICFLSYVKNIERNTERIMIMIICQSIFSIFFSSFYPIFFLRLSFSLWR
jgi:hypothetical protein